MAFDRIQFDPNTVPLRSDLRILVTVRFPTKPDHSIYLDSNGTREGIKRSEYISADNEPALRKQDEVSVVSDWPRYGGPHVVVLPEGQRLLLGQLPEGATVEVALWRKFVMAQTFSNRILVASTPNGIAAFQPRPGSAVTPRSEQIYRDTKQEQIVQEILNSVPEVPVKPLYPENPDVPINPEYPLNPDIPEMPLYPEKPLTPDNPEYPLNPDVPNNPEYPEKPLVPDIPE
jgi:hypothetical protein